MSELEAMEWLQGLRSSWNTHCGHTYVNNEYDSSLASLRAAQEDAAKTEQAYWIVRARKEGLVEGSSDE